jgi:excisionase family DNA binding protein
MVTTEISFEMMPKAIGYLIEKVEALENALQTKQEQPKNIDGWMSLEELRNYLPDHPAKSTIYGWVSQRIIPHHKGGKKLRFSKLEIDNWLLAGKRQSNDEVEVAAQEYLIRKGGRK